jgi:PAS domain S-box-containing protein
MDLIKILHVEDSPEDHAQIERLLRKSGLHFTIFCVSSKSEFVSALKEFIPDVILTDHSLPSFSSIAAVSIAREQLVKIPVILVTGTVSENLLSDVIKSGIDDYVLKDRPLRLPAAILSTIEKYALERQQQLYFNAILQQEKRFRGLIENLSEAIVVIDAQGKVQYTSPAAQKLSGIENEEVIGRECFSLVHPDDIQITQEAFERCVQVPKSTVDALFRLRSRKSGYLWVEGMITNLLDDPAIEGCVLNYRDVTERRQEQRLLVESEANLRVIFDNTDTSYIFLNKEFEVVSFNETAVYMFASIGASSISKGKTLIEILPDRRRSDVVEKLNRVLKGEHVEYEVEYKRPHGFVWLSILKLPVIDRNTGEQLGILVSVNDITTRKIIEIDREKMTADLIAHVKNLEQFAYIVSHNLRSPVANIIGLTNLLQDITSMQPQDLNRCLHGLATSAMKLDEIIIDLNHILQMRRSVDETREVVKLSAVVADISKSFIQSITNENVTIKSDFSAIDEITTVRSYIFSILYNLISNGIKYRQRSRASIIELKTEIVDQHIVILYKDNGLGINIEAHGDKIFGLYKRFHLHTEGKGIGLYMVKTQVEMLGGQITVSGKPNEGVQFRIMLPF